MNSHTNKVLFTLITMIQVISLSANENVRLAMQMYSSQTAWKVGDLITVIIDEETSSSKQESLSTKRDSQADANEASLGSGTGKTLSRIISDIDIPGYKLSGSSEFSGNGSMSSKEALNASFTARVIDVHDNRVLVIQGNRKLIMRKEVINMNITGLIRRRDILANNTIRSSQIADAHIVYDTKGTVSRGSRPGWFWGIFQILNPF